jgi:tetratricopeptide (TPR) repeat protein
MCVIPGSLEDLAAHHAIDAMSAAIHQGATSPEVFFRRGVAHKQTQHVGLAVEDFSAVIAKASKRDSELGRSHFLRSICNRRLRRFDEAIADGDAAIDLRPDDSHVWTVRGFALANAGRLDEAERDLSTALRLDPGNWLAEVYRGFNHFVDADYVGALGSYDTAMAMTDGQMSFGPYPNRGVTHLVLGDLDRARPDLERAVELRPQIRFISIDPRPDAYLALLCFLDGRFADAHRHVHAAEHLGPDPLASLVHALLAARDGERHDLSDLLAGMASWHPGGVIEGTRAAAMFTVDPTSLIPVLNPLTR